MPCKKAQYLVMVPVPKSRVSRRAELWVKRRLNCRAITLSENYRQWLILNVKERCEWANDEKAYYCKNLATGALSYIAQSDVERIADMRR